MSYFTSIVVLATIFALYVLGKLLAARSNAVEPPTVQVVTPKRYSPVAPAMVKPLRAPAPDVSPSVAGALQQLSISNLTADVDDLITAFSSFSMEAPPLKSCLKSDRSRTSRPLHVHFQTQTISEVRLIEVSPGKRSTWCSGRTPHNLRPHIPGTKFWDFYANGDIFLHKSDGVFNPPGPARTARVRCGAFRHSKACASCITPRQLNVLVRDPVTGSVRAPSDWPANLPYYT
ncbi:hypothetical protein V8E51_000362 [Hyaloscypha variabilis]